MSLTAALNAAISGLRVSQAQVQLVSANVAHVNDPTYTKKKLIQESANLGNNQIGGALIAGYQCGRQRRVAQAVPKATRRATG